MFILEECSAEELNSEEQRFIAAYHTNEDEYGYNMTAGGEGSLMVREESKERRRKSFMKYIEEHPEYRENQRQGRMRQLQNKEYVQKMYDIMHSDEYRNKMSKANKGRKHTEEEKRKIGEKLSRPVLCVETGVIYPSATAAANALPGNVSVKRAAKGTRYTAGGFHWQYI